MPVIHYFGPHSKGVCQACPLFEPQHTVPQAFLVFGQDGRRSARPPNRRVRTLSIIHRVRCKSTYRRDSWTVSRPETLPRVKKKIFHPTHRDPSARSIHRRFPSARPSRPGNFRLPLPLFRLDPRLADCRFLCRGDIRLQVLSAVDTTACRSGAPLYITPYDHLVLDHQRHGRRTLRDGSVIVAEGISWSTTSLEISTNSQANTSRGRYCQGFALPICSDLLGEVPSHRSKCRL